MTSPDVERDFSTTKIVCGCYESFTPYEITKFTLQSIHVDSFLSLNFISNGPTEDTNVRSLFIPIKYSVSVINQLTDFGCMTI
jgi:hypothetical protein